MMFNKYALADLRRRYSKVAREKRAELFRKAFPSLRDERILDLGGGKGEYIATVLPGYKNITIADFNQRHLDMARDRFGYDTVQIDGAAELPFEDGEFDIVFCNSVIEHVTGPKNYVQTATDKKEFEALALKNQKHFAKQIRRIGKGYFVQTPYKWFIIESHTMTPNIVQLLPRGQQFFVYKLVPKPGHYTFDFNLLNVSQMKEMFPDAEIAFERSFGLVKSMMAVKRP